MLSHCRGYFALLIYEEGGQVAENMYRSTVAPNGVQPDRARSSDPFMPAASDVLAETIALGLAGGEQVLTVVIEHRLLMRECLVKCMESAWGEGTVLAVSTVADWTKSGMSGRGTNLLFLLCTDARGVTDIAHEVAFLGETNPNSRIVLLSDQENLAHILGALNSGVHGYIPTSLSLEIAVWALHLVRAGGIFMPASPILSAQNPLGDMANNNLGSDIGLTAREASVLDALRLGKPNKVIANELNMCESTVKVHVRNILKKLNARNRTEIAFRFYGNGNGGH
jgi:DNA-binding NarL/FixJ family response regulator